MCAIFEMLKIGSKKKRKEKNLLNYSSRTKILLCLLQYLILSAQTEFLHENITSIVYNYLLPGKSTFLIYNSSNIYTLLNNALKDLKNFFFTLEFNSEHLLYVCKKKSKIMLK